MKKFFSVFFATVIALAVFASCQKNDGDDTPVGKDNPVVKEQVSITVSIPKEGLTKVAFTEEDADPGVGEKMRLTKLSWEETDHITINGESFGVKAGSISGDGLSATFTGDDPGEGPYTIVLNSRMPDPITEQTQPADGDASNLGYNVSITGANAYQDLEFTSDWASSHGGATFAVSSVLQLRAKLPDAIASNVKKVIFKASDANAFGTGVNKITVTLTSDGTTGDDKILDVYAALPAGVDVKLAADMDLLVQFQCHAENEYVKYTAYRQFASGTDFIKSGATQYLGLNCLNIESFANASTAGIGESTANPYLIGDQHQMLKIADELAPGETRYFKLVDNVNMTGVSWAYLNTESPYNKVIDFDGNYKTISNMGGTMFYVFKGTARNLTLDGSTVTAANKKGVFACFIQGINNYLTNVDARNVSTFTGSNGPCGGLVGLVNSGSEGETTATFNDCDVSNVVVNSAGSSGMAGGLIGSVEAKVVLDNCTYSGNTVANTYDFVGGLIGKATAETSVTGCSVSSAIISGRDAVGGLIGHCEAGGSLTSCSVIADVSGRNYIGGIVGRESTVSGKSFSFSKCSFEKGTSGLSASGSYVGGILGNQYGAGTVTIQNCYVNSPISAASSWAGGISSNHYNGTLTIDKCYVMGSVSALYGAGGIVGQVRVANLTINPVAVYATSIKATDTSETQHESSGTIVAYGKGVKVTIVRNCWYDQTLSFSDCTGNTGNPSTWCPSRQAGLTNATISGGSPHELIYPYWGRFTNPTDYPLNKMCKEILGFSPDDWNLDVNPPTLK